MRKALLFIYLPLMVAVPAFAQKGKGKLLKVTNYHIKFEGTITEMVTQKPIQDSVVMLFVWNKEIGLAHSDENGFFRIQTVYHDSVFKNVHRNHHDSLFVEWTIDYRWAGNFWSLHSDTLLLHHETIKICPQNIDEIILGMTVKQALDTLGLKQFNTPSRAFYQKVDSVEYIAINFLDIGIPEMQWYVPVDSAWKSTRGFQPIYIENLAEPFLSELYSRKITGTGIWPDRSGEEGVRYINVEEKHRISWIVD